MQYEDNNAKRKKKNETPKIKKRKLLKKRTNAIIFMKNKYNYKNIIN